MDLTLLDTLKDKLANATDFTDVWSYFFDHFGVDREFVDQGNRARHPFLETILAQIGAELFGHGVRIDNLILTHIPERSFVHGGFTIEGRLGNVIYFEDIQTGLIAVVVSFGPGETKIVRFTGRRLPMIGSPSLN